MWHSVYFRIRERTAEGLWQPLDRPAPRSIVWALWRKELWLKEWCLTGITFSVRHETILHFQSVTSSVETRSSQFHLRCPNAWMLGYSILGNDSLALDTLDTLAAWEAAGFEMLGARIFGMDIGVSLVDPSGHECGEASGSRDDRQNSIPLRAP